MSLQTLAPTPRARPRVEDGGAPSRQATPPLRAPDRASGGGEAADLHPRSATPADARAADRPRPQGQEDETQGRVALPREGAGAGRALTRQGERTVPVSARLEKSRAGRPLVGSASLIPKQTQPKTDRLRSPRWPRRHGVRAGRAPCGGRRWRPSPGAARRGGEAAPPRQSGGRARRASQLLSLAIDLPVASKNVAFELSGNVPTAGMRDESECEPSLIRPHLLIHIMLIRSAIFPVTEQIRVTGMQTGSEARA